MEERDPSLEFAAERQPPESSRVTLRFEKFSSFVEKYASHLSLGGMFLATPAVQPVGEIVGFAIELTDGFRLVEGVGEVVWLRPSDGGPEHPVGMGLRFRALDEKGRELILKILEEQVRSGGEPFEVDEVPADAISTPGAVQELPARTAAGALEISAAERQQRPLEFDAPWGKELPEVPDEILEDTGSLAEPSTASATEPAAVVPAETGAEPRDTGEQSSSPLEPETFATESEASEPPAAPAAAAPFRLAAEAALELQSLPELSSAAPPELDDDELGLDLASDFEASGAAASSAEPVPAPADDSPVLDRPADPGDASADSSPTAAAEPPAEEAGAFSQIAARSASAPATVPEIRPAEARPEAAESARIHGAILDYEEELMSPGAGSELTGRGRKASSPRGWIAGLAILAAVAAGGWWLWERSDAGPDRGAEVEGISPPPTAEPVAATELPIAPPAAAGGAEAAADEPLPAPRTIEEPPPTRAAPAPASARPARAAASTVRDITWQSDARGTWVSITFDGDADPGRVRYDRLDWSTEKEQISLIGIALPYLPATVAVGTSELVRIRTGLHGSGGPTELRLVFDLTSSAAGLEVPQVSGSRLRILVRRGPS